MTILPEGTYRCSRGTANATGHPSPAGFIVHRGSIVSEAIAGSFELANKWNYQLRLRLEAEGIILNRVFQQDYLFRSASAAASVVLGLGIGGQAAWTRDHKESELTL